MSARVLVWAVITLFAPALLPTALLAPAAVAGAVTGIDPNVPTPDPVAAACTWTVVGRASNCDGLDPDELFTSTAWPSACTTDNDILLHTVSSVTMADGGLVLLDYAGGSCRSVAAGLYEPGYSGSGSCTVAITRSSDGLTARSAIVYADGYWSAETTSLYDANVTTYASVSCTYGGHTYTARTSPY